MAFLGTVHPTARDGGAFLPLEHTELAEAVEPTRHTALFARYGLFGTLLGALGTFASSLPELAVEPMGRDGIAAIRGMFCLDGALRHAVPTLSRGPSPAIEAPSGSDPSRPPIPSSGATGCPCPYSAGL